MKQQQSKQVNINPNDMKTVSCANSKCDGKIFSQNVMVKSVSGMLIGTPGQDKIVPIPVFVCIKCGTPLQFDKNGKPIKHDEDK